MTLACEDANSKLVKVVLLPMLMMRIVLATVVLQIWKLSFGHKAKLFSQGLVKILKLKFRQDFEAEVSLVFCC